MGKVKLFKINWGEQDLIKVHTPIDTSKNSNIN